MNTALNSDRPPCSWMLKHVQHDGGWALMTKPGTVIGWKLTWSLGPGRKARQSNEILRDLGWQPVDALPVELEPARF